MGNTSVSAVNVGMLQRAVATDSVGGSSVMDKIGTLKIYNPKPGTAADPALAGSFLYKALGQTEFSPLQGPLVFNPLSVTFFYAGEVYPIDDNGNVSDDKIFFTTSEFGKYTKKTDTIGLAAGGKKVGFFTKEGFESMIRTPRLNGQINQFYERKKDSVGKPYDSSYLNKRCMIYGKFVAGDNAGEYFRMSVSMNAYGITYRDGAPCDPDAGTFEAAIAEGLPELNELLANNGLKSVRNISPDQCDIGLDIETNDRGNFLSKFSFEGLVAVRGVDNEEDLKFVHDLKQEHFISIFIGMDVPTEVSIDKGNAVVQISNPEPKAKQISAPKPEVVTAEVVDEVFDLTQIPF